MSYLFTFSCCSWGSQGKNTEGVCHCLLQWTMFSQNCHTHCTWPASGHCWPTPPPETPGHSWASLGKSLVGSLLLSPGSWGTQGFVCALKGLFPHSWVSSGGSMVGLMVTSSKRAYAIAKSAAPRAHTPLASHYWPIPLQKTLNRSSGSVSVGSLGPGVHKVLFVPFKNLFPWSLI